VDEPKTLAARIVAAFRSREAEIQQLLEQVLADVLDAAPADPPAEPKAVDFGQGVVLEVGEKPVLIIKGRHATTADVRADGLYLDGVRVQPSRGSVIQPAMQMVQRRIGHVHADGSPISLSPYRQWHVWRDGALVPLGDLKDPDKARHRKRSKRTLTLEELGL
jgi:hypothetical protein